MSDDLIKRSDAIKALKDKREFIDADAYPSDCACDVIQAIPSADRPSATEIMNAYHEGVRKGIAEASGADRPQEWIPCNERMPEVDGKYLCCWQGKSVETGMFLNGHFRLYGEIKDRLVTAWMPLPKPYKEEY